jgi:hypothetical protein
MHDSNLLSHGCTNQIEEYALKEAPSKEAFANNEIPAPKHEKFSKALKALLSNQ